MKPAYQGGRMIAEQQGDDEPEDAGGAPEPGVQLDRSRSHR